MFLLKRQNIKSYSIFVSFLSVIFIPAILYSAPLLTYEEACKRAIKQATSLQLASCSVIDARITSRNAYSHLFPRIMSSGRYTHNYEEISFELEGEQFIIQPQDYTVFNLSAEQPIIQLNIPPLIRSAKYNLLSEQEKLSKVLGDVLYHTSELYIMILAGEESVNILKKSVENLSEHRNLSLERFKVGELPETAYLQAEFELGQSELNLFEAEITVDNLKEKLRILLHWEGDFDVAKPKSSYLPDGNKTLDVDYWMDKAMQSRADLLEAEARLKAVISMKKSAIADFYPTLSAFFNWDYNVDITAFAPTEHTWMAGIMINWPLYEGGKRFNNIMQYDNDITKAGLQLELVKETIRNSVYETLNSIRKMQKSLMVRKKQITVSQKNFELVREQYDVGLATSRNVLEANTDLIAAELSDVIDRYNIVRQHLNLLNETGQFLDHLSISEDSLIELAGGKKKAWKRWPDKK